MSRRGVKFPSKNKKAVWRRASWKAAAAKRAARFRKMRNTPRFAIRTSPHSAPNVHMFKRSYDYPLSIGVANSGKDIALNSDSLWQIVKLHTKFNELPDYLEFQDLFSEYKINSICHKLTPFYKNNLASDLSSSSGAAYGVALPNYEIFVIPTTSSAQQVAFSGMSGSEIDKWLMQTQRKSKRVMPSGIQTYWTTKPMVSDWKGPANKDGGNAYQAMARSGYLATTPTPLVSGGIDQTDVTHYSTTILIRRVDGLALQSHGNTSTEVAHMGFRVQVDCFLKLRKVQ